MKHIPNTKIDLLNPNNKSDSRNDDINKRHKKQFLRFES
jgi:hypothetical protein